MAFDAVVIGSGFGGAFSALALTEAGLRVVLLERGRPARRDDGDWDPRRMLLGDRYRGSSPVQVRQYGARRPAPLRPLEMLGGNSVVYGGASLRLRETDLDRWPVSYEELEPHYTRAEALLDVHGEAGADPCEPPRSAAYPRAPVPCTEPALRLRDAAGRLGWRPFPIPLALNFSDETRPRCILCNTCDGFPCKIEAKNDLAVTVLRRAAELGLEIRAGLAALRLRLEGGGAAAVECVDVETGEGHEIEAERFVVAAGALQSPALLLRSGLGGVATPGGQWVGRRLMRHCNAVVAGLFRAPTNPRQVFHKQLCFTEFYEDLRAELGTATGTVQDIYTPAAEVIRRHAPPGLKRLAGWMSAYMQNLLCVAEDDPRPENRVTLSGDTDRFGARVPRVDHEYTADDLRRRDHLVTRARRLLRAAGAWTTRVYEIDTFSHGVGSAAMADSPDDGALDPRCRLWGVDNLWVVDGSCFPASGGVNPSLTIAANALRVAPAIAAAERG